MEPKKICSVCLTENRSDFTFCKNCGSKLPVTEQETTVNNDAPLNTDIQPTEETASADGISEFEERATFIGKNGQQIAQKQMEKKRLFKKSGWNWPVFLFGLFLGLPFIWFFYRKMHKQGTKVLIASLAFLIAIGGCAAGFISPIFEAVSVVLDPLAENDYFVIVNYSKAEAKAQDLANEINGAQLCFDVSDKKMRSIIYKVYKDLSPFNLITSWIYMIKSRYIKKRKK